MHEIELGILGYAKRVLFTLRTLKLIGSDDTIMFENLWPIDSRLVWTSKAIFGAMVKACVNDVQIDFKTPANVAAKLNLNIYKDLMALLKLLQLPFQLLAVSSGTFSWADLIWGERGKVELNSRK